MLSLPALLMCVAAAGSGETVLLDFTATWCGPCRQMEPAVHRLAQMGFPVRKVDIDQHRQLASQFRVRGVPCFVMVVGGREVDRVVGATSFERLHKMVAAHRPSGATDTVQARGQSPDRPSPRPQSQTTTDTVPKTGLDRDLLASSVRLKIADPQGHSYGSGTIVATSGDEALVLTCGHIFRDSRGKGRVTVDLFLPQPAVGLPARVIDYDLQSDVGLVAFRPPGPVTVARLAPANYRPNSGDAVINIGCNNGRDPTVRHSRVTTIDKFLGPPNLQVAGQPVQGRSGGGLFSADGQVIGVCNAADPADNEGLYAALPSLWWLIQRADMTSLVAQSGTRLAVPSQPAGDSLALGSSSPPAMPRRMPSASPAAASGRLRDEEQAALSALGNRAQGAEVICIVRSLDDPRAKSQIVVLDKASRQFMQCLDSEQRQQPDRHLTSLEVGRSRKATAMPGRDRSGTSSASHPSASGSPTGWKPNWQRPQ